MAHSPVTYDKGTRFTNYSSIHSADAFVGDYQVMYTPGATPNMNKNSKSSRFGRAASSNKQANISQSYLLPANMPNTSQIMPDHGALPNIQVHYNIPADEKQIVASLRTLQRDLGEAMQTIQQLTRERDEAIQELRSLKTNARKPSSPPRRQHQQRSIEEDLFDLSSPLQDPPTKPFYSKPQSKKEQLPKQTNVSDDARVLSQLQANAMEARQEPRRVASKPVHQPSKAYKKPTIEGTESRSMAEENPTAASNMSRRRRHLSVDENMTSAYLLPDLTGEQQEPMSPIISEAAQNVLHSLDPEHINSCDVCHRLTKHIKASEAKKAASQARRTVSDSQVHASAPKVNDFAVNPTPKPDYTAAIAGFIDESMLGDPTMRPKMAPSQALMRVKVLMDAQFRKAKERHRLAWEKYDRIEAPLSSRKHAEVSKEMQHWAEKMEECRIHLDYLRDVEEGMVDGTE